MLKHLRIENYALIDQVEVEFSQGFTAITGETGAGKSILMDALDMVLGKRADSQALLDPSRKCTVECIFEILNYSIRSFFEEAQLDYDDFTILRREIYPNGKSRAFINDTPVTLNQLKNLGDLLIDIHAQHATTSLQDAGFQLAVIDSYAGLESELSNYEGLFHSFLNNQKILQMLISKEKTGRSSYDYKQFLLEELTMADLSEDEQTHLEDQLSLMIHAGEIKSSLYTITDLFSKEDGSILDLLSEADGLLKKISPFHSGIESLTERLKSDIIDLKDILAELLRLDESVEHNPEKLALTQQRLDLIYRLQHKHNVNSIRELTEIRDRLNLEIESYTSLEEQIRQTERVIQSQSQEIQNLASGLSTKRVASFHSLEQEVVKLLVHMGIPDCQFEIRQATLPEPGPFGFDKVEFYFNANLGHALKPLADIASGGERSRAMLSIKSILSGKKLLPTIIFDEIDNGLSGDVAGRVGDVLASAANRMQVIVITHLPQIAGKARHQFAVYKKSTNQITHSHIRSLNTQERVAELAKMIGGNEISEASAATAKEMLMQKQDLLSDN